MVHFHRSDTYHHVYGDKEVGHYDEEVLEQLYRELDAFAGSILDKYEDKFDRVIFMSDHGLPTQNEHNTNAFYSCNKELFGDKTPHITDFFGEIVDKEPGTEVERLPRDIMQEEEIKERLQDLFYV